jgi:cell wall-associated NlpC family hydrolase
VSQVDLSLFKKFVGIPYKYHGNNFDGVSCWGLIILIYKEIFDIDLPDVNKDYPEGLQYGDNYFSDKYNKHIDKWVRLDRPQSMSIILFKKFNGAACHAGVMIDSNRFIHAYKSPITNKGNSCIMRLGQVKKSNIEGFYKYAEIKGN